MQPVLVHFCDLCSLKTSVPFSASVFSQHNSCSHCGAVSAGINVRNKQREAAANMQQDELSRLFADRMSLSQAPFQHAQAVQPVHQDHTAQQQPERTPQPITYASQHYTHSYHVTPAHQPVQEPSKVNVELDELHAILLRNSIDPALLFPSQIDLFHNADYDQRLRLLELWRISPPQDSASRQLYDWPPTSLAQEEAMAKLRYEKMLEERTQQAEIQRHQEQLDQSMVERAEPVGMITGSPDNAEPYIVSGYDMLARREYEESAKSSPIHLRETTKYNQATDPVYNSGRNHLWEKNVGSILDMENQYGAFAHSRDYDIHRSYDDEMVM